jgi:hypothetical protein
MIYIITIYALLLLLNGLEIIRSLFPCPFHLSLPIKISKVLYVSFQDILNLVSDCMPSKEISYLKNFLKKLCSLTFHVNHYFLITRFLKKNPIEEWE